MSDKEDIKDEMSDSMLALWQRQRFKQRDSSFFQDERFVEWIAEEGRALIEDETITPSLNENDSVELARSIQSFAAAAKAKIRRVRGSPQHRRPHVHGSPAKVASIAAQFGAAPFLDLAVAAGTGSELWDEECSTWVQLPTGITKGSYVALKVNGESMLPLLHSGDVMVIRLDSPFSCGDVVVARLDDGGFVVKRVGRITATQLELLSINPSYPPIDVVRAPQAVVGTVTLCWCDHTSATRRTIGFTK